ncbi:MAG: hypothetical protein H0V37_02425, partial [Chloroflexia bacterium]|nr:hypothetical protein [Chloroflexia bacterium]
AMQTAHVAGQLGRIAYSIQEAYGQVSGSGGPRLGGPGLEGDNASNQTPLTVPAPEF